MEVAMHAMVCQLTVACITTCLSVSRTELYIKALSCHCVFSSWQLRKDFVHQKCLFLHPTVLKDTWSWILNGFGKDIVVCFSLTQINIPLKITLEGEYRCTMLRNTVTLARGTVSCWFGIRCTNSNCWDKDSEQVIITNVNMHCFGQYILYSDHFSVAVIIIPIGKEGNVRVLSLFLSAAAKAKWVSKI